MTGKTKSLYNFIMAITLVISVSMVSSMEINASSVYIPESVNFDAEYFAKEYPEIAEEYGSDEESLYRYYSTYGRLQGMKPHSDDEKCYIIIGDSRVCGLLCTLMRMEEVEAIATYVKGDGIYMSGKFRADNKWFVLSGEMSGRLSRDSYDRSVTTVRELIGGDVKLCNMGDYTFINMYGINDLYHNQNNASGYPSRYIEKDTDIFDNFEYCDRVYQFNTGPVDERGIVYKRGFVNEYIEAYNQGFVSTDKVTVVDLYSYLKENSYNGILVLETTDSTGLHYDDPTNKGIYQLITSLE